MNIKDIPSSTWFSILFMFTTGVSYFWTLPNPEPSMSVDKTWMRFEKTQLQSVLIERPDGEVLSLQQTEDHWTIQSNSLTEPKRASKTMLNRIKHQLHELDFREEFTLSEDKELETYGLGSKAIRVKLQLLGQQEQSLLVGDLNPSKVSYFVQYGNGEDKIIHTVKKSSMDMFLQSVDAFRESRIIHMDMRSLSQLTYENQTGRVVLQKGKGKDWKIQDAGVTMANRDVVMRMIGRLSALKASSFVDINPNDIQKYGLDKPYLTWSLTNEVGQNVVLLVGNKYNEELRYYWIPRDSTVYVAKNQLLQDFVFDLSTIREQKIFQRKMIGVDKINLSMNDKEHTVALDGGEWYWSDGSLVSGITPQRFFEEIRDAQCFIGNDVLGDAPIEGNQVGRENENIFAIIKLYQSNSLHLTINVIKDEQGDIYLQHDGMPCYVPNTRIHKISEDLQRESNIHQQQ